MRILRAWAAGVTSGFTATTGGGGGAGGEKPSFSTSYNNNGFVASITRDRYTWGHISIRLNQKINLTNYARINLSYAVSGYLDSVFWASEVKIPVSLLSLLQKNILVMLQLHQRK